MLRSPDTAMPDRMHMTGASTSISRTITPCVRVRAVGGSCDGHVTSGVGHVTHSKIDGCDSIEDNEDVVIV